MFSIRQYSIVVITATFFTCIKSVKYLLFLFILYLYIHYCWFWEEVKYMGKRIRDKINKKLREEKKKEDKKKNKHPYNSDSTISAGKLLKEFGLW